MTLNVFVVLYKVLSTIELPIKTTKCGDSDKSPLTMLVLGYIKTFKDKNRLHYFLPTNESFMFCVN